MIYIQLFTSFFKIGLFGFGGGYAMLSLIRDEVVDKHQWVNSAEFTDIVAISQMTPGPIAINSATYIGYTATGGVLGSVVATVAVSLPPIIIMLLVCKFFFKFRNNNKYIDYVFSGLKPAVTGLIAAAAILLVNSDTFIDYKSITLFIAAFIAGYKFKADPILLIVLAGVAGFILY
ncbi:MAG: chromate transporter [Prevotellaceae bacterium]|jgi:chromate transporter|nr:chromate transporter [Prevotellaceae bacterium]